MSQQINLYNAAFIPPREWVTAKSLAVATSVALGVVLVGGMAARWQEAQTTAALIAAQAARAQAQTALDAARGALAARQPSPVLKAQVEAARARYALRERVLAATQLNLAEPGGGFSRYLMGLARQSVPGLWINQLGIDATGKNLSLAGQTLRQEAVPEYVRKLKTEPAFAGKSFAGLDIAPTAAPAAGAPGAVPPGSTSGPADPVVATASPLSFSLLATREAAAPSEAHN